MRQPPSNHSSNRNLMLLPLPNFHWVHSLNLGQSINIFPHKPSPWGLSILPPVAPPGTSPHQAAMIFFHKPSPSFWYRHSHFPWRATFISTRDLIPKPWWIGFLTSSQLIKCYLLFSFSSPQRKRHWMAYILLATLTGIVKVKR